MKRSWAGEIRPRSTRWRRKADHPDLSSLAPSRPFATRHGRRKTKWSWRAMSLCWWPAQSIRRAFARSWASAHGSQQGVLAEGGIVVEGDGLTQCRFDTREHCQHNRNGLGGGLSGEPGCERQARFALMERAIRRQNSMLQRIPCRQDCTQYDLQARQETGGKATALLYGQKGLSKISLGVKFTDGVDLRPQVKTAASLISLPSPRFS
jgi:hypothetical protein